MAILVDREMANERVPPNGRGDGFVEEGDVEKRDEAGEVGADCEDG